MHRKTADIIRVRFDGCHFLAGVVIEHSQVKVVCTADEPISSSDEFDTSDGHLRHFESLDHGLYARMSECDGGGQV